MVEEKQPPLTLPAEDRIRETAKWLTVTLGAVGGVVIAGTQFSNLGAIQPGSWRFWVVLAGAVLAAAGAAVILSAAVKAATTPLLTLEQIPNAGLAKETAEREGFEGGVPALVTDFRNALNDRDAAIRANLDNPNQETELAANVAQTRAIHLSQVVRKVSRVASYEVVADRWKKLSWTIGEGAGVSLLGLLVFIWAINPPAKVAASEASPAVVGEAAMRMLELEPAGQRALAKDLGEECRVEEPLRVAHLATTDTGPDVLVQQDGCKPMRLIITNRWGHLEEPPPSLPAEEEATPAPSP
ncbi:hypothetical protein D477_000645 [Arthrobacter crystallopoietes BAB-32]|uniref:Uncharacterized protein n=1 Tax=Arthrobacter crystallopoietes BAB-32 TaxID=1246476 RepID=N1V0G4_9MICC|nr:hypothetical protein [Arthrobacter crystallopoietes]EMY36146.1 hypothetical protein D477_000645 [Arthrobacter crystallopoietes BAB-32]